MLGDRQQLARVVSNLADNAIRHATTTVSFTLTETNGRAILTVADDGIGIPEDRRQQVFERFTRLDDSRATATGGAGLGLAIARAIVEAHGGTLVVEADDSGGARFVATIPRSGPPPGPPR